MSELTGIITHDDFDGVAGAALLSWGFEIDEIRFAGPITIAKAEIPITLHDIVCDLPYPLQCGMWFDHHAGNLEELRLRGISAQDIPGRFAEAPSCVRVIYDYFAEQDEMPEDFTELANVSDLIDSFAYESLEQWREDSPSNRIDRAIKSGSDSRYTHAEFLRSIIFGMRDASLSDVASREEIVERAQRYQLAEVKMLETIQKYRVTIPEDANGELYVIDTTAFLQPARLDKKLIGLVDKIASGFAVIKPVFRSGRKTNDVAVSLSLALHMQKREHTKDCGEVMRVLNIGDGHRGAAAGVLQGNSAHDLQRARAELPARILSIWKSL
jgi:oligoribonuclease NrnB/cAMP/cGMP phosphodiesterase (DHH superfamily)